MVRASDKLETPLNVIHRGNLNRQRVAPFSRAPDLIHTQLCYSGTALDLYFIGGHALSHSKRRQNIVLASTMIQGVLSAPSNTGSLGCTGIPNRDDNQCDVAARGDGMFWTMGVTPPGP